MSVTSTVILRGLSKSLSSSTMTGLRGVGLNRPRRRGLCNGASNLRIMFFQIPEESTAWVMLMSDLRLLGGVCDLGTVPFDAAVWGKEGEIIFTVEPSVRGTSLNSHSQCHSYMHFENGDTSLKGTFFSPIGAQIREVQHRSCCSVLLNIHIGTNKRL